MKQLTAWIAVVLLSILSVALVLVVMGFRVNITDSIPFGLYRITDIKNLKNVFVIFCPDDRPSFKQGLDRGYINSGLCPGGYGYLMKKVVAFRGDKVSITDKGVFVNQKLITFSKPLSIDGLNRPLSQWRAKDYPLKDDEVLTMTSQSKWSFDSRYYGLVSTKQIKGVITPIWVKNNTGERA